MKSLEARGKPRRGTFATMALLLALLPVATAAQSPGDLRESAIAERVLDRYRDLLEQETLAFTISQAVDVASELHPEVRLNRERLAEFPSLVREARSPYLPQLDLNLQFAQTRDPGFRNSPFFSRLIDDPGASPFGGGDVGDFGGAFTFGTYLWNFQASQVVWSFGLRPALRGVEVGRLRVEADLQEVQNRVARDTATRLYSWLLGLRTRDVLRQAVETSERGLALARDRVELGAAARLDVLRARVQLSRLRRQLSDAEDSLAVERAGINALVGREQSKAIEVLDALELPDPLPRVLPAEALMELAGQQRPTLRQFGHDRELLDVQTSLALADARPEVRASASYGINTFTLENTHDMALHNWNAGVSLTWNLFDGFGSGSRVASLRSQVTQNDWEQNEYESTLEVTLRNATANWAAALTAIEEATLALEEAAETERVATEELEAGAATPYLVMETAQAPPGRGTRESPAHPRRPERPGGVEVPRRLPRERPAFGDRRHGSRPRRGCFGSWALDARIGGRTVKVTANLKTPTSGWFRPLPFLALGTAPLLLVERRLRPGRRLRGRAGNGRRRGPGHSSDRECRRHRPRLPGRRARNLGPAGAAGGSAGVLGTWRGGRGSALPTRGTGWNGARCWPGSVPTCCGRRWPKPRRNSRARAWITCRHSNWSSARRVPCRTFWGRK